MGSETGRADGDGQDPTRSGVTRPPWSEFRAALDAAGFRPSRRFGQNFLVDPAMVRALAADAPFGEGDAVVEVGAGCGFLAVELAARGAELLSLEIDERLAAIARRFLERVTPSLAGPAPRVVIGDVLAAQGDAPGALHPALEAFVAGRSWHVAANLPYSITGPFTAALARRAQPPASATLLVQREVGERLCGRPGSSSWGALSARVQRTFEARPGRAVPARLFWPRPKVESAVVELRLREPLPNARRTAAFDELVHGLFQLRRKGLRAALGRVLGSVAKAEEHLRALGLDSRRRAETLELAELEALAERVQPGQG